MSWVERLQEATGGYRVPLELNWSELESDLGTSLPEDYKQLCARFEPGSFSAFVSILRGGDDRLYDLRSAWAGDKSRFQRQPSAAIDRRYEPYFVYGVNGNHGLIQWGWAEAAECEYFWLADETVDPAEWPVVARWDRIADWHSYTMSTAEFIYRIIADLEFEPLGAARELGSPFYLTRAEASNWDPRTTR